MLEIHLFFLILILICIFQFNIRSNEMKKEFIIGSLVGFFIPILILLFISIIYPQTESISLVQMEYAKNDACRMLWTIGCNSINSTSITVKDFDANRDGSIDSNDTLFELCKYYYGVEIDLDCKKVCGCS